MKRYDNVNQQRRDVPPGMPPKHGPPYTLAEIGYLVNEIVKIPPHLHSIEQIKQLNEQMMQALEGVVSYIGSSIEGRDRGSL